MDRENDEMGTGPGREGERERERYQSRERARVNFQSVQNVEIF